MMSKAKDKWKSVSLPRAFLRRVKAVLGWVAEESIAEYVRQAVQVRLKFDEAHAEEQKMLEKEVRERLKD